MMKQYAHLLLAPVALLSQAIPACTLYYVPNLFYGNSSVWPEERLWLFSVILLLTPALCGLLLGCRAAYLMLIRSHPVLAWVMIVLFCVPAWMQAAFYLQASLVFLAWA